MMIHPRHQHRVAMRLKLEDAVTNVVKEFDPSYLELLQTLLEVTSTWARFARQDEDAEDERADADDKRATPAEASRR